MPRMSRGRARSARAALLLLAAAFGGWSAYAPHARAQLPPSQGVGIVPQAVAADTELLSQPQLEQLLAPIALFPDELLTQMLMAATYPLEVVQATRWLGQGRNASLQGDALVEALQTQRWDPSVKSLVPFPNVLKMMNDQLEWTQQLGDAVLDQQEDVLNAVQVLRWRAQAAGTLASGPQQTVSVVQNVYVAAPQAARVVAPPPEIIVIASAHPERVYVPVYNPNIVFGTWPHPGFPPVFYPPPPAWGVGNAFLTGMAFAGGVAVVNSLWGWARPGWGSGSVNINTTRVNNINVNRNQITSNTWRHDSTHRHGVAYRNSTVSNRVRGGDALGRERSREEFRGRTQGGGPGLGPTGRPGGTDRPGAGATRPGGSDRPGTGVTRPGGGDRPGAGVTRPGGGDRPGAGVTRPGGGDRPGAGVSRPGGSGGVTRPGAGGVSTLPSGRPAVGQQARPGGARPQAPALQGQGQGRDVRAAAQRGQASRLGQVSARGERGGGRAAGNGAGVRGR